MPGLFNYGLDTVAEEVDAILQAGIQQVILFGIPEHKDPVGSDTWSDEGIIQRGARQLKEEWPELFVITDVCFCEYTDHGHCGVIDDASGHADVNNDATLEASVEAADPGEDASSQMSFAHSAEAAVAHCLWSC